MTTAIPDQTLTRLHRRCESAASQLSANCKCTFDDKRDTPRDFHYPGLAPPCGYRYPDYSASTDLFTFNSCAAAVQSQVCLDDCYPMPLKQTMIDQSQVLFY